MRTDTDRLKYLEEHFQDFRHVNTPTMDGKYPCWIFWACMEGRTSRKNFQEAIDVAMDQEVEWLNVCKEKNSKEEAGPSRRP